MTRTEVPARRYVSPFEDLSSDMEKFFDSVLGRTVGTMLRSNAGNGNDKFVPTLDVAETPESYEVSVDIPGVKPEDVKLEVHDGQLTVSGKRENVVEKKDKNYHRVERSSGSFYRSIALPNEIDNEKVEASYDKGVLHIKLPKSAKTQPKKIEIRTGA